MDEPHDTNEWLLSHARALTALARGLVRGEEAADLVQDAFVRGLERPPQPGRRGFAWLRVVCRNLFINRVRTVARRTAREQSVVVPRAPPDPSDVVAHKAALQALADALQRLPADAYEVVRLRYWEDLTPPEIAQHLALPLATVKRRLDRGLQRLRETLGDGSGPDWRLALAPLLVRPSPSTPVGSTSQWSSSDSEGGFRVSIPAKIIAALILVGSIGAIPLLRSAALAPQVAGGGPFQSAIVPRQEAQSAGAQRAVVAPSAQPTERGSDKDRVGGGDTGTIVVSVRFADGAPAPDVGVEVGEWSLKQVSLHCRYAATGADGTCRFEGVAAGSVLVFDDRQNSKRIELIAGSEHQVTLQIDPVKAWSIDGLVVDAAGAPVANAAIWFVVGNEPGQVITRSAADGTFAIRNVDHGACVSARVPGRIPSLGMRIPPGAGDASQPVPLDLIIGGPAASIAGRVITPSGGPVAGAVVLIGDWQIDADSNLLHPIVRLVTDANGHFESDAVRPGVQEIVAGADGFAQVRATVTVSAGASVTADVTLCVGGTIHGRVTDDEGLAVAGAHLYVNDAGMTPLLHVVAANDGTFTLAPVPTGKLFVSANARDTNSVSDMLEVMDGGELEWNPVLARSGLLAGLVLDEHDQPLAHQQIWYCSESSDSPRGARTDGEGRFTVRGVAKGKNTVAVSADGRLASEPLAYVEHVPTGETNLILRVIEAKLPTAHARGRVLTHDGTPPATPRATVWVARPFGIHSGTAKLDAETGDFDLGPLPPGTYQLKSAVPGFAEQTLAEFTLATHQVLELGDLHLVK